MNNHLAIQEFETGKVPELNLKGSKELQEKAAKEVAELAENIIQIVQKY